MSSHNYLKIKQDCHKEDLAIEPGQNIILIDILTKSGQVRMRTFQLKSPTTVVDADPHAQQVFPQNVPIQPASQPQKPTFYTIHTNM